MKATNQISQDDVKRLLQLLEMFLEIDVELKMEATQKEDFYGKAYFAGSETAYHKAIEFIRRHLVAEKAAENESINPQNIPNYETKID